MIEPGTYYPNEPGAKSLGDAKPLYVKGERVSVVVDSEVTLFIGLRKVASDAPENVDNVMVWAVKQAMPEERTELCTECGTVHFWRKTIRARPWFKPNRHDDGWVNVCDSCHQGLDRRTRRYLVKANSSYRF